jgi:hypothetical protein
MCLNFSIFDKFFSICLIIFNSLESKPQWAWGYRFAVRLRLQLLLTNIWSYRLNLHLCMFEYLRAKCTTHTFVCVAIHVKSRVRFDLWLSILSACTSVYNGQFHFGVKLWWARGVERSCRNSSSHVEFLCSLNCLSTVSGMLYVFVCLSAEKWSKSDLEMH